MALYETSRAVGFGQGASLSLSVAIHGLVTKLINWNEARQTRNALVKLTDRELEDIGLSRGDIDMFR